MIASILVMFDENDAFVYAAIDGSSRIAKLTTEEVERFVAVLESLDER